VAIASVPEVVRHERWAGATDDQISRLLANSSIPPPEGFHHWHRIAVRHILGEDASGCHLPDGRHGGGL